MNERYITHKNLNYIHMSKMRKFLMVRDSSSVRSANCSVHERPISNVDHMHEGRDYCVNSLLYIDVSVY